LIHLAGLNVAQALEEVWLPSEFADSDADKYDDALRERATTPTWMRSATTSAHRQSASTGWRSIHIDGVAFFGAVLSRIPRGEQAGQLWDASVTLASFPHFFKLKQTPHRRATVRLKHGAGARQAAMCNAAGDPSVPNFDVLASTLGRLMHHLRAAGIEKRVNQLALINVAEVDGIDLLGAAVSNWAWPVTNCPQWDIADLVRHTGGIFGWIASLIATGERVSRRALPPAPTGLDALPFWYTQNLDAVLQELRRADRDAAVWTFSSRGDHRVAWWRRRLAVEVAIHRWDAEHAASEHGAPAPKPLDGRVAAAGIDEFVTEFLPGLLDHQQIDPPRGMLHIQAIDGPTDIWVDLDAQGELTGDRSPADTHLHGTCSDILLWMTNRRPVAVNVVGESTVLTAWRELRR
jgi:uncharacterized protein (TIGR03083 family)